MVVVAPDGWVCRGMRKQPSFNMRSALRSMRMRVAHVIPHRCKHLGRVPRVVALCPANLTADRDCMKRIEHGWGVDICDKTRSEDRLQCLSLGTFGPWCLMSCCFEMTKPFSLSVYNLVPRLSPHVDKKSKERGEPGKIYTERTQTRTFENHTNLLAYLANWPLFTLENGTIKCQCSPFLGFAQVSLHLVFEKTAKTGSY